MTDADIIAGDGPEPLPLLDGRHLTLRYSMRSLHVLERHYGSLAAMAAQQALASSGQLVDLTCTVVAAGLLHHPDPPTADQLLDLLDTRRIEADLDLAMQALDRALPTPEPGETPDPTQPPSSRAAKGKGKHSRGGAGGTPAPSRSGAAPPSGGP